MIVKLDMRHETSELSYEGIILGCQAVSFVERFAILYPYLGESAIGDSTVISLQNIIIAIHAGRTAQFHGQTFVE